MSRIRGKDTTPEKVVRSLLHGMGYRFRLHVRISVAPVCDRRTSEIGAPRAPLQLGRAKLPLRPELAARQRRPISAVAPVCDRRTGAHRAPLQPKTPRILLPKHKTAIFIHSCFWHRHRGCKNCTTPTNRFERSLAKLNGNTARDRGRAQAPPSDRSQKTRLPPVAVRPSLSEIHPVER
jgi:G:T-mismatch repair DNA endonuclease (very short patch repair protein)